MSGIVTKENIQRAKQRFGIVGNSGALNRAIEVALLIAPTDVSVLVTGESGVGKENFPKIIHHNSIRKHGAFVAVNCGAIPEGTIDSELFGHKKGSFTDAVTERKGYFEVADGGTIFLDEVGELPLATQARLLRVLESGEFMKVGSSDVQRTDIRVVAATNVDLEEAVKEGKFRQDLYYRLNTVTIELPPLRDRGSDIGLLFRKFASDFADKYQMPPIRLDDEALNVLEMYSWPGNIRQLRNLSERLSVIAEDRTISREVLEQNLPANALVRHPALLSDRPRFDAQQEAFGQTASNATLGALYAMLHDVQGNVTELTQLLYRILQGQQYMPQQVHSIEAPQSNPINEVRRTNKGEEITTVEDFHDLLEDGEVVTLKEMEARYIEFVLERNNGARRKTAEDLDISERTLYRKLNRE
ncbi:sigma-54 interaction domain-containing protein [Porphyromonas levii]|uniref:Sigma-54-dependent Fis family transcriptional regulator n=1 Tax=Porphyromonas levii TaxID=28114 RepID=A0A4Y8WNR8_9PORP|nr:sigma-54 dependent transcriptional regulator [Porphyromonas levii]MBR8702675.1 Anaerobic nitric oxide reductase transcription regulator NorR [Porphyromonas levii]MBR8759437.1 Anaerobic nitric oxide reductase transcription regulator NorR [Porphyromonas levii]MBR8763116.1 Anaerobic nitric oxide reductase transcription regulator NorR [Porphyromonas levii]MBR8783893.1 Anaerobic nitric oxide reductase transcription regulator NorR [Porphyromonas levii]TFH94930.1 sigma-54-dependent Fis family tran